MEFIERLFASHQPCRRPVMLRHSSSVFSAVATRMPWTSQLQDTPGLVCQVWIQFQQGDQPDIIRFNLTALCGEDVVAVPALGNASRAVFLGVSSLAMPLAAEWASFCASICIGWDEMRSRLAWPLNLRTDGLMLRKVERQAKSSGMNLRLFCFCRHVCAVALGCWRA